mgnify:CR=1 FL=1
MLTLSIDLETYSSVDIKKSGLYRYVQSPDFEILLFAYQYNDEDVRIVDLKQGETIPPTVILDLKNPNVRKAAFNAAFEFYCLWQFYETYLEQWYCTMVHAWYCGYAGGLDAVGRAMQFPEDQRKMAEGKALIRYFCTPCAPTKRNGGRTRNLPEHSPEKWELFKDYCKQDVSSERAIARRLEHYPVPEQEHQLWVADQLINIGGVALDVELVENALAVSAKMVDELSLRAKGLTGLENPNSVAQLKQWIRDNMDTDTEIESLDKKTVSALLKATDQNQNVAQVLKIRQEMAKTSVKKYEAMEKAICQDGRVRGLIQFYGGQRTGRWAGRLVQVQNLPRNYIESLDTARDLVKKQKIDALKIIYGNVSDMLSQLIRTAFVPAEGCEFAVADFSAIEARVLAWIAGEEWRLEVFRTHGKIYEASASAMFGVPVERIKKGNPEYALRAKGKIAELALGYQGSVGALVQMGALDMGLREEDLPDIVHRWRASNRRIQDFWYTIERCAVDCIERGTPITLPRGVRFTRDDQRMAIQLPSGRELSYAQPCLVPDERGWKKIYYMGMGQKSHKWELLPTYGGKLVENIVQAVARDCLANAILNLMGAGYKINFHIHDEVVLEIPKDGSQSLEEAIKLMCKIPGWAKGLPLNADGFVGSYYKKE